MQASELPRLDEPRFCAGCGGALEPAADGGFPVCGSCKRITYLDPKLAAVAMIEIDGEILLVRRGIGPAYGMWSFPSGYVNRGEKVERALEREVLEETGLVVASNWLVGLYSEPRKTVILAVYDAAVTGGELAAGDETLEVGAFPHDRLPELAFKGDDRIVADWLAGRAARGQS